MKDRLKTIRGEQGMTQIAFAESLGLTRTAYAKYEAGIVEPSETFIKLLCSKFNISEKWLRTGEGNSHLSDKQDILAELCQQYQLTVDEQMLVKAMLNLSHEERVALIRIIRQLNERMAAEAKARSAAQVNVTVTEDEAKFLEAYRKKKAQEADISVLPMTGT